MKQGRYIFTAMAIQTLNSSSFLSNNECLKKFIIKYGVGGETVSTSDIFCYKMLIFKESLLTNNMSSY